MIFQSIRGYLIVHLLLGITLILSVAIIGNLFLEQQDLEKRLDTQLILMALRIEALVSDNIEHRDFSEIQRRILQIHDRKKQIDSEVSYKDYQSMVYNPIQFQVWNQKQMILRSHDAPTTRFTPEGQVGFDNQKIDNIHWRIFSTQPSEDGRQVVVGASYEYQKQLQNRVTRNSLLILLITYPFLAFLIWRIVGKGFRPIDELKEEMKQRDPNFLGAIQAKRVPHELRPFIEELNKWFARLQEALSREQRFAADAAHELKTPLATLKAQAQVALKAQTPQEQASALKKLLLTVDRSTHIVQQLITLSKIEPQAKLHQPALMDLHKQAADVIAELVPQALKKKTDIELISPEMSMPLLGHPTAITILIRNLVDNAIRYTPEGSLVQVILEDHPQEWILKVRDNGEGIPDSLHHRVFERFFRILGHESTGSGLGLGIAEQIARSHGGHVRLGHSPLGKGLEASVTLPKNNS